MKKKKSGAGETLLRQWHLLRKIPQRPRKISIDELCQYLEEEQFDFERRTIERDVKKLAKTFLIESDNAKPAGWFWNGPFALRLHALTATEALTFTLVKQHLVNLMPVSVLSHLEPFFDLAERELKSITQNVLHEWPNKIAVVPPSQVLIPPGNQARYSTNRF